MSLLLALAVALPHVTILSTGGTIASQYDEAKGGLVPALTGAELVAAVPGLDQVAIVNVEQIANIGSPDMTPEIWQKLARRANELLAGDEVTGIVITHGTDTLEETAYFLDLTVTSDKPVILVGAQRAPSFYDTDGPRNLLNAVRVAVSPEATGKGTLVVMNGQIHAAREVVKTNTIARETFKTLEFGALGVANLGGVKFYRAPLRRQTIAITEDEDDVRLARVEIVAHYAGADGRLVRALLHDPDGLDGLVIAGTGLGHVSVPMFDAIAEVRERGIPVVISTRVYTGRLMALYAGKGRGVGLKEIGAVLADNLSPQKARILLMLAMTRTKDPTELQAIFDH
ncbi:MAG: asparaginase [Acidobacteria bacterium]|nr:MAG: asparaginase [Acidobacteriota bacterium]